MKRWLLALCLGVSFSALADNVTLIPVYTPKPKFPIELRDAGIAGATRVQFVVHSNGSVTGIKILKSDNPLFSKAAKKAVKQWKFKPWEVTAGRPASVGVVIPMIFAFGNSRRLPMDINAVLAKLPCTRVNAQVAERNLHKPAKQLHELSVFHYVSRYLSEGILTKQLSAAERLALQTEFAHAIPQIVERCGENPGAFYADQMPERVRALL
ncbi:TonB domain-containing protein [Paucimonas lemoignei]|nr:TonB domain-containing protein [Paucimonas lemoignei]